MVGHGGQTSKTELVGDLFERGRDAGVLSLSVDEIDDLPLSFGQFWHISLRYPSTGRPLRR